ncbi:hypothetical protein ACIPPS_17785 [Streptomyces sp. NPDC090127]|uniref:hypothetical protein n=1 Tax=Streptomyces sp. NPDC090127 TaxID=3365953 RepID=UPI0037FFBFC6
MSAHEIPAGPLYLAFAVTGGLAWLAGGRRRGRYAIAGGLAAVQTALHLIFSAGRSHAATAGDGGAFGGGATTGHRATGHAGTSHPGMDHEAMGLGDTATDPVVEMAANAGSSSLGMLAAHLLAALVCGLWLARGEAALFALARTVGASAFTPLRLLLAVVRVPELPRPLRPRPHHRRLHGVALAHTLSRRGPPRLSAPRATALGAHV